MLPQKARSWFEAWLVKNNLPQLTRIEGLAGDGSVRTFYRLRIANGYSFVLLCDPEWIFSKDYAAHQAHLKNKNIPVPEFFEVAPTLGYLIMEDLGDELLQARLLKKNAEKKKWLLEAVSLIVQLHGRTYPVPSDLPAASRRFDAHKYWDEISFTIEHLHTRYLNLPPLSTNQIGELKHFCKLIENIRPLVFSHRDYHTRNLLLKNEAIFMIDFQDARLGPPHYDLASLLYDAYVPLREMEREELIETYQDQISKFALSHEINWQTFRHDLQRIAYQRVLKAAGSFASFYTRFGKKTHLSYLLPALGYAEALQEKAIPKNEVSVFNVKQWMVTKP